MDQDATWCGGRPRPRPHCVRRGPSFTTERGRAAPHFSAHVYCGQTVVRLSYCCDLVEHSENQNVRISQQKDNAVSGATVALLRFWRRLKQVDFSANLIACNFSKCSPILPRDAMLERYMLLTCVRLSLVRPIQVRVLSKRLNTSRK